MSASVSGSVSLGRALTSTTRVRISAGSRVTEIGSTPAGRDGSGAGGEKTFGRITAMRRPVVRNATRAIAFRVMTGLVVSTWPSMTSIVAQSVTMPASRRAASRGARSRPAAVLPTSSRNGCSTARIGATTAR